MLVNVKKHSLLFMIILVSFSFFIINTFFLFSFLLIFHTGKLQIVLYYVFLYTGADELICTMSNY